MTIQTYIKFWVNISLYRMGIRMQFRSSSSYIYLKITEVATLLTLQHSTDLHLRREDTVIRTKPSKSARCGRNSLRVLSVARYYLKYRFNTNTRNTKLHAATRCARLTFRGRSGVTLCNQQRMPQTDSGGGRQRAYTVRKFSSESIYAMGTCATRCSKRRL